MRWDLLMVVATGLLLIGQGRVHSFVPAISAIRPAFLLSIVGLVLLCLSNDRARSPARLLENPVSKAALFVAVWAVLMVPFSLSLGGSTRFLIESFSRTFIVFLILTAAVRNLEDVRRLVGAFALGAAVFAFMAPVERALGGGAGGYDTNDAAMFMASALPALVFFIIYGRRVWTRMAATVASLAVIAGVVSTQSRGGFLALVVVLAFMLLMLQAIRPSVRITIVALVIAAAIPVASTEYWERIETITELDDGYGGEKEIGGRVNTWERGLQYTWENPLTGLGVNQFPRREGLFRADLEVRPGEWRAAHSTWVQALAELGIPGFIGFLGIFFISFKTLRTVQCTRWKPPAPMKPEELRALGGLLMASLLGAMVAGSFLTHAYSTMMWGMIALVVALRKVVPWRVISTPAEAKVAHSRRR